uniref:Uncharacterized protein n=1 Tax=Clytia hemisphaerica TaxID=252671 RepID=A0A7M5X7Z6_9CNID
MGIAISTITMASGLAAMTGGPVGFLVAIALDTVKTILTLIDKHQKGPLKSESSKLQKAIEKSLRKFTETELSADWNGYKRLTEVFLKHLDMIESFDEIKPLTGKDEEKFNIEDMGGKEEVKQQLFDEVSPQIYKVLTASTHLLGKIEHHISKVCDFDIQARKVKEKTKLENWGIVTFEKEPIPKEDEIEEKDSFATSCLKLYELYAKITTYHYQTYLKGLEVIQKIVGEKYYDTLSELQSTDPTKIKNKEAKKEAKEEKSRRKAYVFMQLLLDMIQNSREYNKKVFKPFLNPYEHYKMRYTVNYYHNNAKMYEHLNTYLKEFYVDEDIQKKVMFCSQQSLLGSCYLEDGTKAQQPGPWRSAYVPKGKRSMYNTRLKGTRCDIQKDGLPIKDRPSSMACFHLENEVQN